MATLVPLFAMVMLLPALMMTLAGCQTERVTSSDGRPMPPRPRPATQPPESATVSRMAFMVGSKPDDTTGNGYPDLIRTTVVLFTAQHDAPLHAEGTFEFMLYPKGKFGDPDAQPLAQWRIGPEEAREARAIAQYGPCYQFELSLLESGADRLPLSAADLRARFIPEHEGRVVNSRGVRTIQIGRRTAAR